MINISQKTINSKISCNSVGIHSGENVIMSLLPAPSGTGIVFRRIDVAEGKSIIKANYKNVVATSFGTVVANEHGVKISTVEHLMAAIWGCGIDNLIIEVNAPEIPIMDGSSAPFVFMIECAGIMIQDQPRKAIEVMKTVRVEDGDKFAEVAPSRDFVLDLTIDFNHPQIKQQKFYYNSSNVSFKNDVARARTFGFKHEIDHLIKAGLAKGGSLDNAILVDENGVVNKEGLRYKDEFVRHKVLDFIGDIYLAGHFIVGSFTAFKSGHGLNSKMLHQLFSDQSSWRMV